MESSWEWVLQFLGRLHPLVVHFPIGLLVVGFVMELLTIGQKRQGLRPGIHWMIFIGAAFAVLAAILGWLLSTFDEYTGELITQHQNIGIATAVMAGITALILRLTTKGKLSTLVPYRAALTVTVVLLSIAGHFGANLTHGEDFLTSVLPGSKGSYDDGKYAVLLGQFNQLDTLSEGQHDELNLNVRAIFAHNCHQCHSEDKKKGELALDSKRGVFDGGESGVVLVPGKPEESELFKRITLSPNHKDVMPKKGKVLKPDEINLIKLWIQKGAHWSDRALKVFPEAPLALVKPAIPTSSSQQLPLDKFIDIYFEQNKLKWPELVNDRAFIRRAYLDIVGLLPDASKIDAFLQDSNPKKRETLVDTLLADHQNYTQHWLSFWNDLLRNDYSGPGFITGGRKQITQWLYTSLETNKPYDQMIKELINPTAASEGFIKGIEWRGVINSSQSKEMQAAQNIGQALLGTNVKCASCHNSFVSNLTLEQSYGFASVFADSVLELNRCDLPTGKMAKVDFLYPELGSVEGETVQERLYALSELMTKRENGRLYRTLTNRIWKRLMGRGLVEPVDEMDNTPWDNDILDWLASDFIDSGHDLKHLIRTIITSKTYQLRAARYASSEETGTDYVFHGPTLRRLSAEQFSDAVSQVIAPVYYAAAYDPLNEGLSSSRIWHRELKFDRDVLPEPGTRYFRQGITLPKKEIRAAKIIISVDHSYTLFINGTQISKGTDWRKVDKIQVEKLLKPGQNLIAIEGLNEGSIANPAGILIALKVHYQDGEEAIVSNNKNWKSTAERSEGWKTVAFNDAHWTLTRDYGSQHWDKLVNYTFNNQAREFVRASLVKQDPFLKALGRPTRENVATFRDEQATLLQALELTNGTYFNTVLEEGASLWLEQYPNNSEQMMTTLYQNLLGRKPSAAEKKAALTAMGERPTQEGLEDLFWSVLIQPEFQFIY